ncbi:hypothetical protein ACFL9T_08235 [Thermodesulfobacteriota bacterium]
MPDWIPFKEGEYLVEMALLVAPDKSAVLLEDASMSVFLNQKSQRQMNGGGRVQNTLIVQMLDVHDNIDLLLDFGDEFKFLLKNPVIKGGKIFSPNTKSALQFAPREPWQKIPEEEFKALWSRLNFICDE